MYTELLPGVYDIAVRDDRDVRYRTFLVDAGVPTLVDTGLPDTMEALFEGLEGIEIEPERAVITHGDVGGLEAVTERYDVTTYVPEETDVDDALVEFAGKP